MACYCYVLQPYNGVGWGFFLAYPQAFATSSENQLLLSELLNLRESKMC